MARSKANNLAIQCSISYEVIPNKEYRVSLLAFKYSGREGAATFGTVSPTLLQTRGKDGKITRLHDYYFGWDEINVLDVGMTLPVSNSSLLMCSTDIVV